MITLKSPAKINLFLKVVGRRKDGYHELASLFQAIDLCDVLQFEVSNSDELHLHCNDSTIPIPIPLDRSNLIWKAVDLFKAKTGIPINLKIKIDKCIPIQAGLGGGSSNAATTLWALNYLSGSPATTSDLQSWSSEIGSDIPFFFSSGSAYCTGRGEIVQPLNPLPPQELSIYKPHQGLSTPEVYRNLNISNLPPNDPQMALKSFINGCPVYFNDLEESALSLLPSLRSFKQNLIDQGFETVMLSGSGSSFICFGNATKNEASNFIAKTSFLNRLRDSWY